MIKKIVLVSIISLSLSLFGCKKSDLETSLWNKSELLKQTPNYWDVGLNYGDNIKAIMYDGQQYNGQTTNIFAFLGIPTSPKPLDGYPAILLIHGGLGRAFPDWVKMWTDRGYIAIAPDFDAQMSTPQTGVNQVIENSLGGPKGYGVTALDLEYPEGSWLYQSVSNIVIAHNLLRSLDDINQDKIGITGISWGSYLTGITLGVDERLAFAMPVYGAGFMDEDYSSSLYSMFAGMSDDMLIQYREKFDPSSYLKEVNIPTFWVQGVNDFAFSPVQKQKTVDLITKTNAYYAYYVNMPHGQEIGASRPELFAFADSVVNDSNDIIKLKEESNDGSKILLKSDNGVAIKKSYLFWTDALELDMRYAQWYKEDIVIENNEIHVKIPVDAQFFFVEVTDQHDNIVSSKFYRG